MDDKQLKELLTSLGERMVEQKQSAFERHAQTVLVGFITLVIGWVGISLTTMKEQQNKLITGQEISTLKIEQLTSTLTEQQQSYVKQVEYVVFRQATINRLQALEEK
jgi:hypothetical protein